MFFSLGLPPSSFGFSFKLHALLLYLSRLLRPVWNWTITQQIITKDEAVAASQSEQQQQLDSSVSSSSSSSSSSFSPWSSLSSLFSLSSPSSVSAAAALALSRQVRVLLSFAFQYCQFQSSVEVLGENFQKTKQNLEFSPLFCDKNLPHFFSCSLVFFSINIKNTSHFSCFSLLLDVLADFKIAWRFWVKILEKTA